LLSFIGLLGFDQVEKNIETLFRGERMVVIVIRVAGFGKGMKYAGGLFHLENIS
jgi:hypothetical protein